MLSIMKPEEKVRIIQKMAGLTQEKLAAELGVSFATLNSWINGKSIPRKKAQERIDALYSRLSGQNVIPPTALEAKKKLIAAKSKKLPEVLKRILGRKDLYDEFMLSLTFNSNKIEGSTLSEPETAAVLFENAALPDKSLVEQMEVKNHQAALQYLFRYLGEGGEIEEALLLKLHGMLMNGIQEDAGRYRLHGVRIAGAHVPRTKSTFVHRSGEDQGNLRPLAAANYLKIPELMARLSKEIQAKEKDVIAHVSRVHSRFEQIHPFSDGNGRVGRLLMNAMLLRENIPPALILQEHRRFYMMYLNKSQLQNDFIQLEDFVCDAVLEAYRLFED